MKFKTYKEAIYYAKKQIRPHKVVKSRYWDNDKWGYVECYTVILA